MPRPTVWRRSFNLSPFPQFSGSVDLLTIQPDETLGGTWWQYSLKSVGAQLDNLDVPMRDVVVVAGLILVDEGTPDVLPMNSPGAGWLWWEQVTFDHVLLNNIDFAWAAISNTGGTQRKVKAMRKNDGLVNQTLRIAWQTHEGGPHTGQTNFQLTCAAEALVILPGPTAASEPPSLAPL